MPVEIGPAVENQKIKCNESMGYTPIFIWHWKEE
jgi:hypothetical protein